MHVWIEPLEWDESNGPCPIAQLDVSTTSYLRDLEASGTRAISAMENPCLSLCLITSDLTLSLLLGTLHWKISRSSLSDAEIRYNLSGATDRQFRAWSLPAGISHQQMAEHWDTLKFGPSSKDVAFKSSYVRMPSKNIQQLRDLARSGRDETERLVAKNKGKGKIVWGIPEELMVREDLETKDEEVENAGGDIHALVEPSPHDAPPAVALEEVTDLEVKDLEQQQIDSDNFSQEVVPEYEDLTAELDSAEEVIEDETIGADLSATDDSLSVDSTADSLSSATPVPSVADVAVDMPEGVASEAPAVADTSEDTSSLPDSLDVASEVTEKNGDLIERPEVQTVTESSGETSTTPESVGVAPEVTEDEDAIDPNKAQATTDQSDSDKDVMEEPTKREDKLPS